MLRARLLACILLAATPTVALAQDDDWGVKQNPFDPRIVERWKGIIEHDPSDATALKKLVDLYSRYSTVDKLIKEYEAKAAAKPDSFAYIMIVGHLRRARNDVEGALAAYEKAAQVSPKDPSVHLARAELYKQRQKKAEAAAAYEQALPLARSPKEKKPILRALADLALDAGAIEKARGYYKDYIDLDPNDVTARLELADALSKHGLHDDALKEYNDAIKRLGTDPAKRVEVLARVGAEQEALGKTDDAIVTYRAAMDATQKGHFLRKDLTERIIDIFRKKQDLRGLIAFYEKTWGSGGRGHFEWDVLARLYEETGEQDKALDAYRHAVTSSPTELDTQRRLIGLLDRAGKDDEVIKQYEAVIRVAPGEPRFQLELAERLFRRGEKAKALAMLKEIAGHFPDDAGVHGALADLYSRWGEEQSALKEYETLVRIEPNDDSHLVNLGEQWYQKGEKAKAMEIWKRLASLKTAEAYARLGEVYAEHDLGSDAIEMYGKALQLKPRDPAIWRGLAGVLERQRQDDRAIEAWERVMEFTAGDPAQKTARREARTRIIAILSRKPGQALSAKTTEWQRLFGQNPPDLEAGYRLAEAFLKLTRYDAAERTLAAILKIDPKDLEAKHQLVSVLKNEHKYADAIALLKELAAEQPGMERQYYTEIADLELALYHDDEAIAWAEKALEKSPNDPQAQERLAEIFAKREDFARAVAAYKRAVELDQRNYKVRFALAKLYARLGVTKQEKETFDHEAALLYRDIIKRAPDEETVRNAARKAIDIEEVLGTLGELEKEVAPLAFLFSNKVTYRRILVEVYERYVPPLVARAHAGDEAAVKELVRLGEHGLKPLLEALEDTTNPAQQRVAVRVLGYLGNKNAAPPLVKVALEAPPTPTTPQITSLGGNAPDAASDMDVRVEALVAAGRLGDARIIPQLVQLLGHREVALREAAAWSLGQTRAATASTPLVAALADSRSSVHTLACIGLGRVGDSKGLDKAAEVMKDSARHAEPRAACAYALGLARSAAHLNDLTTVVATGNDDVQVLAAWALGRIGDARALPALYKAYWQRKQAVRDAIALAIDKIARGGDTTALPTEDVTLEGGKIDFRALVRGLVVEHALARAGHPTAPDLASLRAHVSDLGAGIAEALANAARRDTVVRVLRDLDGGDGGLTLGVFALGAPDSAELREIVGAVGAQIAARVDALAEAKDAEVQELALDVLAKLGDARAPQRIAKALDDDSATLRLGALRSAQAWLAIAGPKAQGGNILAAAVAKHLKATSYQERQAAAEALGMIAVAETAPLAGALADPDGFVREAAARALGHLHRDDAIPPLLDATRDEVAEVRLAAAQALAREADARARTRLAEMARDDVDARVRAAAANH